MRLNFNNKIILITGATRGIGKKIADDLHDLGAHLLLTGTHKDQVSILNEEAIATKANKRYFCVDLLSQESLEAFLHELNSIPRIDGLVNNAGINRLNTIEKAQLEDWRDMMEVNLTAPFRLIGEIAKKMILYKYGRIINIASIFSKISKERRAVYSATKFGLHGLTVGVSNDLSRFNILVNTLSPGFVLTDLTRKNLSVKEMNELIEMIPAKRLATVDDISNMAIFLLSDMNTYMTGQNIVVDGGFTNV